jgi:uridine kinase
MASALDAIAEQAGKSLIVCGNTRVILIDGPAGSGKTTFAHHLAQTLNGSPVISMDELYNGWHKPLSDDLYARMAQQIFTPLQQETNIRYQKYDWHESRFENWIEVANSDYLIIEGVGAMHPKNLDRACLKVWLEANEKLLLKRVLGRDGEHIREQMLVWQKMEQEYFKKCKVADKADFALQTN